MPDAKTCWIRGLGVIPIAVVLVITGCSHRSGRSKNGVPPVIPKIASVTPDTGYVGGGDTVVIVTHGFQTDFTVSPPIVTFDTAPAPTVVPFDATILEVVTPADPNPDPSGTRSVDVTVECTASGEAAVRPNGFTYEPAGPPCLAITPNTGSVAGKNLVIIDLLGSCLATPPLPIRTVEFDGIPTDYVYVISPTSLECEVPPGAQPGLVDVAFNGRDASGTPCRCVLRDGYAYQ